jgi:excisionase family DNA binding protein
MGDSLSLQKRLGNVNDISLLLNVSAKTVRRLTDAGKLPGFVRVGRLHRYDLKAVGLWIEQGCPPMHRFNRNSGHFGGNSHD